MRKLLMVFLFGNMLLFAVPTIRAQAPNGETNCPSPPAISPYVGGGTSAFSQNQNLCLPQLAPVPTPLSPLAFIVQGTEPSDRVDAQGSIYVVSIRGVPGGVDLWRWDQTIDGGSKTSTGTPLPFKYEGQPDNCGILTNGCANNVGSPTNLGVAPGGGDADIAINAPDPNNFTSIPNLPLTSLTLAGVTATHSTNRGDSFSAPNVVAGLIPGDDRQWNDAIDTSTVYLSYHDIHTFQIEVQRSIDGGVTYVSGFGEAIDPQTFPAAFSTAPSALSGIPPSGNIAGQIRIDHSSCPSRGNLYSIFAAPETAMENAAGGALRSVYVGVSTDAKDTIMGTPVPAYLFTDHKIFTGLAGAQSQGAVNIFPALATDDFGFVYAVWSDNSNIFYSSSSNQGATWTTPVRVNQGATTGKANVFPWVVADANGHAVVAWFGSNFVGNSNDRSVMEPSSCSDITQCWAKWNVYAAETVDGHDLAPVFTQSIASDHVIHYGTVSTGGLGGGANRNLGDFFQVALDPLHRANISFSDDHEVSTLCSSQSPGHCSSPGDPQAFRVGTPFFTYQLKAANIVTTGTCATTPPPTPGAEKITGGGQIPSIMAGHTAKFGFEAQNTPPNAALSYHDDGAPGGSIDVRSVNTVPPTVNFMGNCASFNGDAKVNQNIGYTYGVSACDNGGTGKDTFSITVTGPNFSYHNQGTLTGGNIQIHSE